MSRIAFLAFLLIACAPAPVVGAITYPTSITLHGVTVRLVVMPDVGWTAFARAEGMPLALAWHERGTITVPAKFLRRALAHEFFHAWEFARTGRNDTSLVTSCLSSPLDGLSPLYACQRTEYRARLYEERYRNACGTSLYPFGFPNEKTCTAPKP